MKAPLYLLPGPSMRNEASSDICTDLHPAQRVWGNNTLTPPLLFYLLSLATKRVLLPSPHPGRALLGQLAAEQHQQLGLLEGQETFCHQRACFSNILEK